MARLRERVQISFENSPSRTKQSFRVQTDINTIVARYRKLGLFTESALARQARINLTQYSMGDVSSIPSYQDALNLVNAAKAGFDALPAKARERFQNDHTKMMAFLADPANVDEAVKLGLMDKKPVPPVAPPVPPVAPPVPPVAPPRVP